MISSRKPGVHNVLHCHQKRTEPRQQTACTESFVKFGHVVFGQRFVKRFALCYRTVVLSVSMSCPVLSVCDVGVLWPNGWIDQNETCHGGRLRPRRLCVRWRPSSPKRGTAPQFSAHVGCGQTVAHLSYTAELLLRYASVQTNIQSHESRYFAFLPGTK